MVANVGSESQWSQWYKDQCLCSSLENLMFVFSWIQKWCGIMAEEKSVLLGTYIPFYHERKSFPRNSFSRLPFKSFWPELDPIVILAWGEVGKWGKNMVMIYFHDPSLEGHIASLIKIMMLVKKKGELTVSSTVSHLDHSGTVK